MSNRSHSISSVESTTSSRHRRQAAARERRAEDARATREADARVEEAERRKRMVAKRAATTARAERLAATELATERATETAREAAAAAQEAATAIAAMRGDADDHHRDTLTWPEVGATIYGAKLDPVNHGANL